MNTQLIVPGIKCNGCVATITNGLKKLPDVTEVNINLETKTVNLSHNEYLTLDAIKNKLLELGFKAN